jgi:hypothetical protein
MIYYNVKSLYLVFVRRQQIVQAYNFNKFLGDLGGIFMENIQLGIFTFIIFGNFLIWSCPI